MEFKDITTWSVSKGVATPKKVDRWGDDPSDHKKIGYNRYGFSYEEAQQHTYATDAPDGSYSADRFGEIIWQIKSKAKSGKWLWNDVTPFFKSKFENYIDFSKYCDSKNAEHRLFLHFIYQVKEAEIITLDINDFSISIQDIERAFCYGYLANPESDCLDSAEMMRRYELFKTNYLTPMLSRKGIID